MSTYWAPTDRRSQPIQALIAWALTLLTLGYLLPWAIAATRGKSNALAVGLLNLLLGWTLVGWLVAVVMACSAHTPLAGGVQINVVQNGYPGYPPPGHPLPGHQPPAYGYPPYPTGAPVQSAWYGAPVQAPHHAQPVQPPHHAQPVQPPHHTQPLAPPQPSPADEQPTKICRSHRGGTTRARTRRERCPVRPAVAASSQSCADSAEPARGRSDDSRRSASSSTSVRLQNANRTRCRPRAGSS
jgi:hypothetical protein